MTETTSEPPKEGALTEYLLRTFAVVFYVWAVVGIGSSWWADTSRHTLLLLLIAEGYTMALVVTARRAQTRDLHPLAIAATMYAAFFFVILRTENTVHIVPEWVGATVLLGALAWEVASKVTLGRSFGLLPAHRKVVLGGPYRVVRHPIYMGYLVHNVGFLLTNFHWLNLFVMSVLLLVQIYRIQREELFLSASAEYRQFQSDVPYRLIPFVW